MEKLEAKLKAVDWAVRDVLVGTMRSPQQLDICRKHCFYYIPAERLQDSDFPGWAEAHLHLHRLRCTMLNFFIGFAFFEAGAFFGFFVAALLNAARAGQESTIFEENDNGTE